MNHLAVFYTNNKIYHKVLNKVIEHFIKMINNSSLPFNTIGVIVSENQIFEHGTEYIKVKNIIAPNNIISKGHLSIIEKISLALELFPSEYVSLHEHDVLYPEDYLLLIQNIFKEIDFDFDYLAYNNIIGVNNTGYQKRMVSDYPLSTLVFNRSAIFDLLFYKRKEFVLNKNWCYLEPGYGGSYGKHFRRIQLEEGVVKPIVHINMDQTTNNHHFTNHYLTYEAISTNGFNEWPGDLSYLFK